jgi:hypothetical protein
MNVIALAIASSPRYIANWFTAACCSQEDRPFLVEWVLAVERPHPFGIVVLVAFRDSSIGVDDDAHTMLARGMIADPDRLRAGVHDLAGCQTGDLPGGHESAVDSEIRPEGAGVRCTSVQDINREPVPIAPAAGAAPPDREEIGLATP